MDSNALIAAASLERCSVLTTAWIRTASSCPQRSPVAPIPTLSADWGRDSTSWASTDDQGARLCFCLAYSRRVTGARARRETTGPRRGAISAKKTRKARCSVSKYTCALSTPPLRVRQERPRMKLTSGDVQAILHRPGVLQLVFKGWGPT